VIRWCKVQRSLLLDAEQVDPDDRPATSDLLMRVRTALEEECSPRVQQHSPPHPGELMGSSG
jgi:hypothetical protein